MKNNTVLTPEQKEAKRLYDKANYQKNKTKKLLYYQTNKSKISDYYKKYNQENKYKNAKRRKIYYSKNKDVINKKVMTHHKNNKEKINQYLKLWKKQNRLINPIAKLRDTISSSIKNNLKKNNYIKKSKTVDILGCSFQDFKLFLESKFESWMNWDNYGNPKDGIFELNKTWDIDHIISLSTATCEIDIINLNHYTNLRPLCSYYNRWIKRDN